MQSALKTFLTRATTTLLYRLFIGSHINEDMSDNADESTRGCDAGIFGGISGKDVLKTKVLLLRVSGLPLEIVDIIVDFAEYWPCTSVKMNVPKVVYDSGGESDVLILRSLPLGYSKESVPGIFVNEKDRRKYLDKPPVPLAPESIGKCEDFELHTNELLKQWAKTMMPRGKHPCRKIVFTFKSHDQGWGGDPPDRRTYNGSYTWFDIGLERFTVLTDDQNISKGVVQKELVARNELRETSIPVWNTPKTQSEEEEAVPTNMAYNLLTVSPPVGYSQTNTPAHLTGTGLTFSHEYLPDENRLQANMTACPDAKEYVITWSADDDIQPDSARGDELESRGRGNATMTGEFVRSLKIGDVVTVWAKARFPGWNNTVEAFQMDVYWAV